MNEAHATRVLAHQSSGLTATVRWIDLRDEYPPADETVLVCCDDGTLWAAWTDGKHWYVYRPSGAFDSRPAFWCSFPLGPIVPQAEAA